MTADDIRTLYRYNGWATNRLLDAATIVEKKEFVRELGTSHGSLRGTFVHIIWAEWIWLQRWRGESPKVMFDQEEFPDLKAVETLLLETSSAQQAFLDQLTDARLATRISYINLQGERWEYSLAQMMQHVVNHSSYHRGQVVTLLRQLGRDAPPTDFLVFIDSY